MVYGILLTSIFKYLQIPLHEHSYTTVNSVIHGRNIQKPIPLSESLIVDVNSVDKTVKRIIVNESIQKLFNQLEGVFERKNQELKDMVECLDKKLCEFQAEKQKALEQYVENNSLLITTIGELQNKIYLLEQFYVNSAVNNQRVIENPNSGMERIHMLANECEMMERDDKDAINMAGGNGQSSQALGITISLPMENFQFAPSNF